MAFRRFESAPRLLGVSILLAFGVGFSLQAQAEEVLGASSVVNVTVMGELSQGDPDSTHLRVTKLLSFLEQEVTAHIPADIVKLVRAHPTTVFFREDIQTDEIFKPSDSDPNRLEIYLRPSLLMSEDLFPLVAHTYFHALHYAIHPGEDAWIREGMAQLFEDKVLGRLNASHVVASMQNPSTPLVGAYSNYDGHQYELIMNPSQYGHDLMYFYYLDRECGMGADDLFWAIARGKEGVSGAETVRAALAKQLRENPELAAKEQCSSFEASVREFEKARFVNRSSLFGADRTHYFLISISSALPVAEPRDTISVKEIRALQSYQPVPLSFDAKVPALAASADSEALEHFWIEKSYPYSVLSIQPAHPDASWIQVIFKP